MVQQKKLNSAQLKGSDHLSFPDIEDLELALFIKVLYQYGGIDFSQYQQASFKRRVIFILNHFSLNHISELIPKVLHDNGFLELILSELSIGVTELFRDPWVFDTLREKVFPSLNHSAENKSPNLCVWNAGCATGEEVYSLCILLDEARLLKNTTLYATDFNKKFLEIAKSGILLSTLSIQNSHNYHMSGGKTSLINYFTSNYDHSKFDRKLLQQIQFRNHNLVQDNPFCMAQLIVCRNVLIYFNRQLQEEVLQLLDSSLVTGGFLVLGTEESLMTTSLEKVYTLVDTNAKIYKKCL